MPSNNNPEIVGKLYLDNVKSVGGCPKKVVGDRGTENSDIAAFQRYFRRNGIDESAGENSFLYGKSVSNQRIEAYWSQLRKSCTAWWMNFFKDLIEAGVYDTTNHIHSECMKFVFTTLLQRELDVICDTWYSHRIRNTNTTDATIRPAGRPDVICFTYTDNYLHSVNQQDIGLLYNNLQQGNIGKSYTCSTEFFELANILMNENNLNEPTNAQEGLNLFTMLCQIFFSI